MEKLNKKQQSISVCLSIIFCLEIVTSIYFLHCLSMTTEGKKLPADILFLVICISGFLGGATRALNMLIINLNYEIPDKISARLSRWFLYLVKPFVGIGGGIAFFIVTNMGLLTGIEFNNVEFHFYGVLLISFTGGMFFEDVFNKLHDAVFDKKENKKEPNKEN